MSGTTDSPEPTWTHLTALLDRGGHVTIGRLDPFDGVAVAADTRRVFASLLRREGDSAVALMARLEATLQRAAVGDAPKRKNGSMYPFICLKCDANELPMGLGREQHGRFTGANLSEFAMQAKNGKAGSGFHSPV